MVIIYDGIKTASASYPVGGDNAKNRFTAGYRLLLLGRVETVSEA